MINPLPIFTVTPCNFANLAPKGHQKWALSCGGQVIWHPEDAKIGPPHEVIGSSGTLRTAKVVPHLGGRVIWRFKDAKSGPPPTDTKSGPPPGVPVDLGSISTRNRSGMQENQHDLVKMIRAFDASPAMTTGMRQDHYFVSKS